jgi:NAD(P)-dependent dehydrogenase (short-subunit alcohol dehydrogenase family)
VSSERVVAEYVAQTPLGRLETPEEIADVVVFLCLDRARFMTGQGVNITGGAFCDVGGSPRSEDVERALRIARGVARRS